MRLAFLVVYVFEEKTRPLFDIHLEHIRRYTKSDFKIFAAAHKLPRKMLQHVEDQPEIEVVDCGVPRNYGVRDEHAHCLDHLAAHASSQDFSHFMCVHLDSFPIDEAWSDELLKSLEEGAVLASLVPNGYSGGLFWPRSFQEKYTPRMLVSAEERKSIRFQEFQEAYPDMDHVETGLGYIYRAWSLGLPWRAIETDTNKKIYGGLFFHLVGGTFRTWVGIQPIREQLVVRSLWCVVGPFMRFLPVEQRHRIRRRFIDTSFVSREGTFLTKEEEVGLLISNPEAYLASLQVKWATRAQ